MVTGFVVEVFQNNSAFVLLELFFTVIWIFRVKVWPGGVLPYMDYIGMCRREGMVFKQFTLAQGI